MKKLLLVAAMLVATAGALAQNTAINGTLNVANTASALGTSAPVTDAATGALCAGSAYLGQIYAGATADSLSPIGSTFVFKVNGLFSAGGIAFAELGQGKAYFVKVATWDASGGASYDAAAAAGKSAGFSNVIGPITTGGNDLVPPATPANLTGLQAWSIKPTSAVPEPTTIALGLLGAAGLLLRRRL